MTPNSKSALRAQLSIHVLYVHFVPLTHRARICHIAAGIQPAYVETVCTKAAGVRLTKESGPWLSSAPGAQNKELSAHLQTTASHLHTSAPSSEGKVEVANVTRCRQSCVMAIRSAVARSPQAPSRGRLLHNVPAHRELHRSAGRMADVLAARVASPAG
jgi:hypothetical protein